MLKSRRIRSSSAHSRERGSVVAAKLPVLRPGRKLSELGARHVNERCVITTLEIDVGLHGDAIIDDHVHPVWRTNCRHRTACAVPEQGDRKSTRLNSSHSSIS